MPRVAFAVLVMACLSFVPLASSAATPASPSDVQVLTDPASSPALEIEVIEVEAHLGRDFEILVRIRNVGTEILENVEVSIEQRDARSRARAYESAVHAANLGSGGELYVGRLSDRFRPRPGDTFLIAAQPFAGPHPSSDPFSDPGDWQQVGISQCISFCNRCAEKAVQVCGGSGTAEYDCLCGDTSTRCTFKCKV